MLPSFLLVVASETNEEVAAEHYLVVLGVEKHVLVVGFVNAVAVIAYTVVAAAVVVLVAVVVVASSS